MYIPGSIAANSPAGTIFTQLQKKFAVITFEVPENESVTEPLLRTSAQQDGKDGHKISRASLNMRRGWAAKKSRGSGTLSPKN
jgi:hypothetical protein